MGKKILLCVGLPRVSEAIMLLNVGHQPARNLPYVLTRLVLKIEITFAACVIPPKLGDWM